MNVTEIKASASKIVKSKAIEHAIVPVAVSLIGLKTTYDEFKKSKTLEEKKESVVRNLVILSSTAIGAYLIGEKIFNRPLLENKVEPFKTFIQTYINNLSVPVGGIVTGFISGEIFEKFFESKKTKLNEKNDNLQNKVQKKIDIMILEEEIKKKHPNNKLFLEIVNKRKEEAIENLDPGTIGKIFAYAGIGLGEHCDNIFSTLSGFKVGKERGFKNRLRKAVSEIVVGDIVPVGLAVPLSMVLDKRLKNEKNSLKVLGIKALVLIPLSTITTYLGEKLNHYIEKRITDKLVEKEFWLQLQNKEKKMSDHLIDNYFKLSDELKSSLTSKLITIRKLKNDHINKTN